MDFECLGNWTHDKNDYLFGKIKNVENDYEYRCFVSCRYLVTCILLIPIAARSPSTYSTESASTLYTTS